MAKAAKTVLYLTDKNLLIQTERSLVKSIIFPQELLEDQHVVDLDAFTTFLIKELDPFVKKISPVIVILGSGILFQSFVTKKEEVTIAQDTLRSTLPFPQEYVSEKTISTPTKIYLLATHRLYMQALINACREIRIELQSVLPLTLFSDEEKIEKLKKPDVKAILSKKKLHAIGNFLEIVPVTPVENSRQISEEIVDQSLTGSYRKVTAWNVSRLLIILGFLIVLTVLMGGLLYVQYLHVSGLSKQVESTVVPTQIPTPTAIVGEDPANLKVVVMNGTGIAGQAGRVKDLLSEAGYTNVITENSETKDYQKTEIIFSSKVSEKQQSEIKELLLKTFTAVTSKTDTKADKDIQITTGEEK